jgi:ligand-binding sensor domain-containing protein
MKKIFMSLVTFCLLIMANNLQAQVFTNYTTMDGLLNNNVLCVDVDTANNVWFGTQTGISMFDGTNWTSYDMANYSGLVDDNITAIMVASDDRVWVGTDYGVSVFNGTSFTSYTTVDGLGNNRINHIAEDLNGVIWFGEFSGATKYDGSIFTAYGMAAGLPFGGVNHISFDSNNDPWMASGFGGAVKYDGATFTAINTSSGLLNNIAKAVVIDAQDNKWVGTGSGISVINAAGQVTAHHTIMLILPPPDTLNPVVDLDMDSQGRIWTGVWVDYLLTVGGVAMYDGNQWIDYDVSDGLVGPVINELVVDGNDNVWVVTSTGVSKISNVPTAIDEIVVKEIKFKLFPNPATTYLNLNFEEIASTDSRQIEIYSTAMQQIASYSVDGAEQHITIPVGDLNTGLYFIRIDNEMAKFLITN